jgi:hypothetical protein
LAAWLGVDQVWAAMSAKFSEYSRHLAATEAKNMKLLAPCARRGLLARDQVVMIGMITDQLLVPGVV